jgi:hypothetical protein
VTVGALAAAYAGDRIGTTFKAGAVRLKQAVPVVAYAADTKFGGGTGTTDIGAGRFLTQGRVKRKVAVLFRSPTQIFFAAGAVGQTIRLIPGANPRNT